MGFKYLSKKKLAGFEKYKYNSVDTSILSVNVMHPFWNWCVQYFPKWIAPNLLTFIGFLLTVLNLVILSWYDYSFRGNTDTSMPDGYIPRSAWLFTSISLFVAYTLDGIDGKQARRTGTSGPLGELFDHGLDSYSAVMIPTSIGSIFLGSVISPLRMYFIVWNILINFYLTHWEKYNTGVMFLPWGYDFTMIGTVVVLFVTSIIGPKAWDMDLPGGITVGLVFELTLYFSAMITSHTIILWNVYKSYRDKTGHMRNFCEAMRPLFPLAFFFCVSCIWAVLSPYAIVDQDPRAYYILTGTIFSNISCRLIVSQMSCTRCEGFNSLLYPYTAVVLIALMAPITAMVELFLLYSLCFITTIAHLHYGLFVVREMCAHFRIRCFHIKKTISK